MQNLRTIENYRLPTTCMGVVVIRLFCYSANGYSAQLMIAYDRREHWYISVYATVCVRAC